MNRTRLLLTVFCLAQTLIAARAHATLRVVEQAVETSTLSVSLPDRTTGSIALKSCATCKSLLLQFTPSTQFLVGRTPISYAEFVALARGGTDRGLGVFYDGKERTVTRLIMSETREAPRRRRR